MLNAQVRNNMADTEVGHRGILTLDLDPSSVAEPLRRVDLNHDLDLVRSGPARTGQRNPYESGSDFVPQATSDEWVTPRDCPEILNSKMGFAWGNCRWRRSSATEVGVSKKRTGLCHRGGGFLLPYLPGVSLRAAPWLPAGIPPGCDKAPSTLRSGSATEAGLRRVDRTPVETPEYPESTFGFLTEVF